jgi:hypothetical protein
MQRLLDWLERGPTPLKIGVLAFALGIPTLWNGYFIDDYAHLAAFSDLARLQPILRSPWQMFSFVEGDPVQTRAAIELGMYPWWTSERLVLNFWRPVTVLSHGIDHALWPGSPFMAHVQSVAWFAALAMLVAHFYRAVGQTAGNAMPGAAALAALLWTMDDARALPVAWIANRNALLAAFWGVACLLLHLRWRHEGRPWALVAALAALALSVQSNEGGIATVAYLFAYAVFLDRGTVARRAATLAPYAALVVVWRAFYTMAGFGAKFSPLYIDPVAEPVRFAGAVAARAPALLMGQWTNLPSEIFSEMFFAPDGAAFAALSLLFVLVLGGLGAALWIPSMRTRESGFWALGMALAVIPVCATFASNRLLLFAGLGAMGLLARFIAAVPAAPEQAGRARRSLCTGMIALHLALAPVMLVGTGVGLGVLASRVRTTMMAAEFHEGVETQTVVIANAPNYFLTVYLTISRELAGLPAPRRMYSLSPNNPLPVPTTMTRVDERTLRVAPEGGFPWMLFRSTLDPMAAGDRVELEMLAVRVVEVNAKGVPQVAEYEFSVPLEDPGLVWIGIEGLEYRPFALPAVGETLELNPKER